MFTIVHESRSSLLGLETQDPRHLGESPICSPELGATDDRTRGEMDIDPSDAQTGQPTLLNECHGLVVTDHQRRRERGEQLEHLVPLLQPTETNLTDHVRVAQHVARVEMCGQHRVMAAQMVHPD